MQAVVNFYQAKFAYRKSNEDLTLDVSSDDKSCFLTVNGYGGERNILDAFCNIFFVQRDVFLIY